MKKEVVIGCLFRFKDNFRSKGQKPVKNETENQVQMAKTVHILILFAISSLIIIKKITSGKV